MRIVQLIDSLEPGGAERMAVNYANALAETLDFSGLVATRKEGALKEACNDNVNYAFLDKKSNLDLKAFGKLRNYCKKNKITHLHAHSSSFLWAVLLKLTTKNIKVIWHNHLGASDHLKGLYLKLLQLSSYFFNLSIAVNPYLKKWASKNLNTKQVIYLPNFSAIDINTINTTKLFGADNSRILYLANLRPEKNHQLILEIAQLLKKSHPKWTFHLVGNDNNDAYSQNLKTQIETLSLQENVYLYGAKNDVSHIIAQANFGILTSLSEGLPVSLLEMGKANKTVIASNVGDVQKVVINGSTGILVNNHKAIDFYDGIVQLIENQEFRDNLAKALYIHVNEEFDEKVIIQRYLLALQQKKNG